MRIDAHQQEAFVVGEVGVVPRSPLLDQLAFQQQRLRLRFDFDRVEIGDQRDQRAYFRLHHHARAALLKIG